MLYETTGIYSFLRNRYSSLYFRFQKSVFSALVIIFVVTVSFRRLRISDLSSLLEGEQYYEVSSVIFVTPCIVHIQGVTKVMVETTGIDSFSRNRYSLLYFRFQRTVFNCFNRFFTVSFRRFRISDPLWSLDEQYYEFSSIIIVTYMLYRKWCSKQRECITVLENDTGYHNEYNITKFWPEISHLVNTGCYKNIVPDCAKWRLLHFEYHKIVRVASNIFAIPRAWRIQGVPKIASSNQFSISLVHFL